MDHEIEETVDSYTGKEFAKDLAIGVAQSAAAVVIAYAALGAAGYAYSKYLDRKAKKTQKEN